MPYHTTPYLIMLLTPLLMISLTFSHFLVCLMYLETLTLVMLVAFMNIFTSHPYSDYSPLLLILSLGACEASMGLAILVHMIRSHGNDQLKTMMFTKC